MSGKIDEVIERLHTEQCSCVIFSHGSVTLCWGHGVKDLLRMLETTPEVLSGALIADKVIGKGAAAIIIKGGVSEAYADVISGPALELFRNSGVEVTFKTCVPNIINRSGEDICPVEKLCSDCVTADECIPVIQEFVNNLMSREKGLIN